MRFKFFLLIAGVVLTSSTGLALEITFSGLPDDYTVYQWTPSQNAPVPATHYQSDRYERLTINIPDEHIQRTEAGHIDLLASLEAWRRGTPRGPGYPFTSPEGIARVPFYTTSESYNNDTSIPPNARLTQYISLNHFVSQADDRENLRFHAHNGETVSVVRRGLVDELRQIRSSGSAVRCDRATGLGSRGAWTAAECMLCNCANEAGIENLRGKTEVTRVVLRRVVSSYFPNSICDVILYKNRNPNNGRIQAAFSWTYGNDNYQEHHQLRQGHPPGDPNLLNDCIDSSITAIDQGPSNFDHYYAHAIVTPGWSAQARYRERIGRHTFLNKLPLNQEYASALEEEIRGTGGDIIRPIPNFTPQPEEESDVSH